MRNGKNGRSDRWRGEVDAILAHLASEIERGKTSTGQIIVYCTTSIGIACTLFGYIAWSNLRPEQVERDALRARVVVLELRQDRHMALKAHPVSEEQIRRLEEEQRNLDLQQSSLYDAVTKELSTIRQDILLIRELRSSGNLPPSTD